MSNGLPFEELPAEQRVHWKDAAEYEHWMLIDEWAHRAIDSIYEWVHNDKERDELSEMYYAFGDDPRFKKEHGRFSHLLAYRRLLYCARIRGFFDDFPKGPDDEALREIAKDYADEPDAPDDLEGGD